MARKTTPQQRPGSRQKSTNPAEKNLTRQQTIENFYKNAQQSDPKRSDHGNNTTSPKKGSSLKIALWAAAIVIIVVPATLFGGGFIGDWMGTNTAAGNPILPLQPYVVPLNQKSVLRIESFIELKDKLGLKTVCHYRPRFKAAILSVLSNNFSQKDPASVDAKKVTQQLRDEIKKSATLNEVLNIHVKSKTVSKSKKDDALAESFVPARLVYCK